MHRNIVTTLASATLAALIIMAGIAAAQQKQTGPLVEVFKSPTCGCCANWVEHMRASGFTVRTTNVNDLTQIKTSRGVPVQVQSCHTAIVNGYVVEGHVPAADVHRLLKEKPAVAGIAVSGGGERENVGAGLRTGLPLTADTPLNVSYRPLASRGASDAPVRSCNT